MSNQVKYIKNMRQAVKAMTGQLAVMRYLKTPLALTDHFGASRKLSDPAIIDLVTIAFNNVDVIGHQAQLLRKNLTDPFYYTVADNSTDPAKAKRISQLCQKEGVGYIRLPSNPHDQPSFSHGVALNWVYQNYIRPRGADYFGLLDHDIFPVKSTSLIDKMQSAGLFGHVQEREEKWYLWPGFCFFKKSIIKDKKLNFMPVAGLDSGGGNWEILYKHYDKGQLSPLPHTYEKIRQGNDPQSDMVEYLGDWMHVINASNWKGVAGKDEYIGRLLSRFS